LLGKLADVEGYRRTAGRQNVIGKKLSVWLSNNVKSAINEIDVLHRHRIPPVVNMGIPKDDVFHIQGVEHYIPATIRTLPERPPPLQPLPPHDNLLPVTKIKSEQECTRLVLAREQKKSVIDQYQTHATDTGSPEVQIAIISERIGQLTDHFKTHQKDHGSRRGLLMLVSKRRRLLDYLKRYDSERYKTVIGKLGIRK
jgi:small subunit ribosomal protein S15